MESVNVKIQNVFHGQNNITCGTNCKYRTAMTLCTLNVVCFRYIILNALHKGDKKYDDYDKNDNNNSDDYSNNDDDDKLRYHNSIQKCHTNTGLISNSYRV